MEIIKLVIAIIIFSLLFYTAMIWVLAKVQKSKEERIAKVKAEILEKELKELAKWGVNSNHIYVIHGKLTMSIYAMITLSNNPDYITHLRKEALDSKLPEDFFIEQLLLRIEKAKIRIQNRINDAREKGEDIEISVKLKNLGDTIMDITDEEKKKITDAWIEWGNKRLINDNDSITAKNYNEQIASFVDAQIKTEIAKAEGRYNGKD